ncbi:MULTISPECIES: hypothetical protein [unclassified Cryobacterium]|uniref:hypothetical protein n=1 Tax=unclassified Cryobacterium TaxID=2649013 RepID=UPI001304F69A|nr:MULTISPECIES: hypothetical protein [unclassified Cryobacterium]
MATKVIQVLELAGQHVIVFCAACADVFSAIVDTITGTYAAPRRRPARPVPL